MHTVVPKRHRAHATELRPIVRRIVNVTPLHRQMIDPVTEKSRAGSLCVFPVRSSREAAVQLEEAKGHMVTVVAHTDYGSFEATSHDNPAVWPTI
jgi:hypothetical protein